MIISDRWKEPTGQHIYQPTGKEVPFRTFGHKEDAYYMLAGMVEDVLGPEGGTVAEIYHKITGPKGLSSSDTLELVRNAKKEGYLK